MPGYCSILFLSSAAQDYVVLCHGHVAGDAGNVITIEAPLYWAEGTHLPTVVRSYGKPAKTFGFANFDFYYMSLAMKLVESTL